MRVKIGNLCKGDKVKIIASRLPFADADFGCEGTVCKCFFDGCDIHVTIEGRNTANTQSKFFKIVGFSDYEIDFLEFVPSGKIPNAAAVTERDCVVCKRKNYTDAKCCWWCGCQNPT